MEKEIKSKQDAPAVEIAQMMVSKAFSRVRNIGQVVGSLTDAMDVLSDKLPDMADSFVQIKEEIKKYRK